MPETKPPDKPVPIGGNYFSSVKKAREALKHRANETYEKLLKIIDMAAAAGDFETAAKYAWMLLEHTPKDEGQTVIDHSAAKAPAQIDTGPRGPVIQIGVKVGGAGDTKALPAPIVIDAEPSSD